MCSSARSGCRRKIADHFENESFPSGLTYNSHPLACATALATIAVYEEDGLIERARRDGRLMAQLLADLASRHPSVGAVRSIGLFGIVELVRNRQTMEPMAPFNGTSPEMAALVEVLPRRGPLHHRPLELLLHQSAAAHHRSRAARRVLRHQPRACDCRQSRRRLRPNRCFWRRKQQRGGGPNAH